MCKDCIPWRLIVMQWMNDRKEGRTFITLDSNLFNDMHLIYDAIPDYHIEK